MINQQPNRRRTSAALAIATAIAIPAEGLRQFAYYDPPGILTVCYGHTGGDVVPKRKYSMPECDALLDKDMQEAVVIVEKCRPGLSDAELAAFADAVYNLGPTIVCDKTNSTAARLLSEMRVAEACQQLPKWNKATIAGVKVPLPGLTSRRNVEMKICLGDDNA